LSPLPDVELPARPRHRLENNIRMDIRETGWEGVYWIHLAHDGDQWQALVNTVMSLQIL